MNLNTLSQRVSAGEVESLELLSLEGGFYVLRAMTGTSPVTLSDERGQAIRLRSTTELRELLANLPRCRACWCSRWYMMKCADKGTAPSRRCGCR